jgi:methylaspartate ammonia-lyase
MLEVISQEYGLPLPATAVPLHAEMGQPHAAEPLIISHRIASLGYTILSQDPETQLGHNSELLQRYVRHLRDQIVILAPDDVAGRSHHPSLVTGHWSLITGLASDLTGTPYHPVIHLDVRGALGRLYDDNPGKILGALYGLEQTAAPYQVRLANPVLNEGEPPQTNIGLMRQLKEYVSLRRMKLQLVATVHSPADARAVIESGAAHMIQLNVPRLGSLSQAIEIVLAGRQKGMGVLLGNMPVNSGDSARFAAHLALATQPELLMVQASQGGDAGIVLAHNEMARALAWLASRESLPS